VKAVNRSSSALEAHVRLLAIRLYVKSLPEPEQAKLAATYLKKVPVNYQGKLARTTSVFKLALAEVFSRRTYGY
jgi:hypothetical protein